MSKFIDRLKTLTRQAAPAIGFRSAAAASAPPPLVIVTRLIAVEDDAPQNVAALAAASIDAGIVPVQGAASDGLKAFLKSAGSLPLGLTVEGADGTRAAEFAEQGFDFLVFGPGAAMPALNATGIGKILEVSRDSHPEQVRAFSELEGMIDAVFVSGTGGSFVTVDDLLTFRRVVRTLNKPVIAEIPSGVGSTDLKCLWDAGLDGIVLTGPESIASLDTLKEAVAAMPRGVKRQWSKPGEKLSPRLGGLAHAAVREEPHEHEEEEEED